MQGLEALNEFKSFVSKIGGLGRYEDTYIVHAAEGETVVPMEVLDQNPILKKRLFKTMMDMGIEPGRYIVGNELNSKNPITGQPEFFLKKIGRRLRKAAADISGYAAPIAGALFGPGVGAATGALLGQYKRENPGDPTQGLNMALRGGIAGIGSNIAGGQNIFTGKGLSGEKLLNPMDLYRKYTEGDGLMANLKDYVRDPETGKYKSDMLQKLIGKSDKQRLIEKSGDEVLQSAYNDLENATNTFQKEKILKRIKGLEDIKSQNQGLFAGLSMGQLASLYGLGSLGLGFLIDQTTDDGDIGAQADTMPEGNVLQGIVNPVFASKGGVMDLQDGGESVGPGTGTSDSIPAMLSDGEFVMTAKAVRGAGGGDRREGARKMYQAMDELEARA
jgi:hypothetical protein